VNLGTLYLVVASGSDFRSLRVRRQKGFPSSEPETDAGYRVSRDARRRLDLDFSLPLEQETGETGRRARPVAGSLHGRGRLYQIRVGHRHVDRSRLDRYDHPVLHRAFRAELHDLAFLAAD